MVQTLTPGYFALVMASGIVSARAVPHRLRHALDHPVRRRHRRLRHPVRVEPVAVHRPTGTRCRTTSGRPGRAFGFFTFVAGDQRARRPGRRPALVRRHPVAAGGGGRGVAGARLRRAVERGARAAGAAGGRRRQRHLVHLGGRQPVGRRRCGEPGGGVRPAPRQPLSVLAIVSWSVGVFLYAASGDLRRRCG